MTCHKCADCKHLTRTSPTQVFLLCEYWKTHGIKSDPDYAVLRCHRQPWAPACEAFKAKAGDAYARTA